MSNKFNFSCQCRTLAGTVELPNLQSLTRLVCYCEDCQAYARHLSPEKPVLGLHGGSDMLQLSPAHFHIHRGIEKLGNLRLTESGIYRWHATCCNSSLCNTPQNPAMPYIGLMTNILAGSHKTLDNRIGPVRFGVCAGSQHPIRATWPVSRGFGLRGMSRTLLNIGRWRMAGDHNRSQLIDAQTGAPLVEPYTLSDTERSSLYAS